MADDPFLASLLFEEEGPALDFKRDQYKFYGGTDAEKAELLKDILALANTWRRADGYILVGISENPGGKAGVVGITAQLKDADLQQFINSKTNAPVEFAYYPAELEQKQIGVIRVPVQDRPRYLLKPYGGLAADTVYVRRGSSTASAKPDEVARMGAAAVTAGTEPELKIVFADSVNRRIIGAEVEVQSRYLEVGEIASLPDLEASSPTDYLSGWTEIVITIASLHLTSSRLTCASRCK